MLTPIKDIGKFYSIDHNGYLINPASSDNIPESLHIGIQVIKEEYLNFYSNRLRSLYIRGSIVRGTFISHVSDLDFVGLVSGNVDAWEEIPSFRDIYLKLKPVLSQDVNLDLKVSNHSENLLEEYPRLAMVLKTQGLCIYGDDITASVPPYKINKSLCFHYRWLKDDILSFRRKECVDVVDRQSIIKLIIRSGFELVIERSKSYTLDLYPSVQVFGDYYPSYKKKMESLLFFYLNPNEEEYTQNQLINDLGAFIMREIEVHLR